MGQYKGTEIPDELIGLIRYMESLEQSREELSVLGQQWDLLTILGQMSGSGTNMSGTREDFKKLTSELLGTLGEETIKKTLQSLNSMAQVTVDIVIRNLFERTADIGFLATDEDIRQFLKSPDTQAEKESQLRDRFSEYVAKYSVYSDIILYDTEGKVLCKLDQTKDFTHSSDPVIEEAIDTDEAYVEVFKHTDMNPQDDKTLIYAYRVTETNDPSSKCLGVLCLVFKFADEMGKIFDNLITEDDWTVLTLLDSDGKVIACSDESQVAVGSKMSFDLEKEYHITKFGGRNYLTKTLKTNGYQGFTGLGWLGHAMIPLEYAFSEENKVQTSVEEEVIEAVTENKTLFTDALRQVPLHAEQIQSELDRTVWNGNVREDSSNEDNSSSARKVLLWEISTTGNKTRGVFERAIGNLHETVVGSIFEDSKFIADLAIDIMDRNLYERANDCRWWALTTKFREVLAKPSVSAEDLENCKEILAYINGLYTVYTNLFLYDKDGKILAVSNKAEESSVGKVLKDNYIRDTLSSSDSQAYFVSDFKETGLYKNKHTYIYSASICDLQNPSSVLGGIGIVFDSEPEFNAMLSDSLPRNESGQVVDGYSALYVDKNKMVVSSTNPDFPVGSTVDLPDQFFNLKNGQNHCDSVLIDGDYYSVGASCSKGYREYKSYTDAYNNDVVCLTMIRLGEKKANNLVNSDKSSRVRANYGPIAPDTKVAEFATFYVNGKWLGFKKSMLLSA
jgi:hypothetical protein